MDSGNSGSVSSSDEEYDADPSSFLNHFGSISHPQQPSSSSMFDLSSSYLHHALSHSSFLNLDSQGQRLASSATNQCLLGHHDNINNMNARQQSKKRSRASRRAPTTVLTTDTSNFRSMVQEFTGIPAPPFSPSSFSRRLPLLSTSRSTLLPYQPPPQNLMHHSIPSIFQPSSLVAAAAGFDHAHHDLVGAQGLRSVVDDDGGGGGRRDPFIRCLDGNNNNNYGGCKLNMSVSASTSLNHEKNLENVGNSPREGAVEAWINSSSRQ